MVGYKLALLKQAMSFVIDRLGPRDRLSIVAFDTDVGRWEGHGQGSRRIPCHPSRHGH
jgi:hypothetical protein